ncbi:hypothetical protein MNBD_GAMMA11-3490 [hydrothermal vent metagenome]|uniref:Uncharacterized protein n=1 Tax=hydrothermal vent metagenome TaxID=652676 RepID=A0A3B0X4T5_9ZZZZ
MQDTDLNKNAREMLSSLDTLRVEGKKISLESVQQSQLLASVLMQREKKRLQKKLGLSHPRVRDIEQGLTRNFKVIAEINEEIKKQQIRIPDIQPDSVLVHGRISDEAGQSLAGLSVNFTDTRGNAVPVENTLSNASGYFSVVVPENTINELEDTPIQMNIARPDGEVVFRQEENFNLAQGENRLISVLVERSSLINDIQAPTNERTTQQPARKAAARKKSVKKAGPKSRPVKKRSPRNPPDET